MFDVLGCISHMMTSSNGNVFHVTGPLCGEFTGHRWIPRTKARGAELWCFLWPAPWMNGWENNREAGELRRHRAHYDVTVLKYHPSVGFRTCHTNHAWWNQIWFFFRLPILVDNQRSDVCVCVRACVCVCKDAVLTVYWFRDLYDKDKNVSRPPDLKHRHPYTVHEKTVFILGARVRLVGFFVVNPNEQFKKQKFSGRKHMNRLIVI